MSVWPDVCADGTLTIPPSMLSQPHWPSPGAARGAGPRSVTGAGPAITVAVVTGLGDFIAAERARCRPGDGRTRRAVGARVACGSGGRGGLAALGMAGLEQMSAAPQGAVTVIKIGGGLTWVPHALDRVCLAVGQASRGWPIVVVPGGGPFAEGVREFDRRVGISSDVAHWMAILAMDQYAHVLASRIPGAVLVEEPGCIREALGPTGAVVLAPSRWMRSADVLPHTWDVTSDSIAAFVAGALVQGA